MSDRLTVTIVDYGVGNLLSVIRALEKCGANYNLASKPEQIIEADSLILPGVGAFSAGMETLKMKSLIKPIKEYAKKNKPFLGICLGMQMMFDLSYEFGEQKGLGLIPGKVLPIPNTNIDGKEHKIPHIGWSKLIPPKADTSWQETILSEIKYNDPVYFVHSFYVEPAHKENLIANCDYNGIKLSAVVRKDNLYGCQFHPEKSGPIGLKILERFCYG